jgi:hypothetical protein
VNFASTGSPGRVGGVHLDVITAIRAPRAHLRTETAVEGGGPRSSHRQRAPWTIEIDIVISDAEPIAGASLTPLWERDHARKTRERLQDLELSGKVIDFFDGAQLWRTPNGSRVWVLDGIDDTRAPEDSPLPGEPFTWRATLRLGEIDTFETAFTSLDTAVDASIQDDVDGIVDTGTQSTEAVPADLAATIPG